MRAFEAGRMRVRMTVDDVPVADRAFDAVHRRTRVAVIAVRVRKAGGMRIRVVSDQVVAVADGALDTVDRTAFMARAAMVVLKARGMRIRMLNNQVSFMAVGTLDPVDS